MGKKLSFNEFKQKFYTKFPNSSLILLKEFKKDKRIKIIVEDKYGKLEITREDLLEGVNPSIQCALNKEEYLTNQIVENHKINYKVLKYISQREVLVETKYGKCKTWSNSLLKGHSPSIRTALNKTEYFINQFKEMCSDKYTLEDATILNFKTKIKVKCKQHGYFNILPYNLKNGKGCKKCMCENASLRMKENPMGWTVTNWIKSAEQSKRFDSFKTYIIKCWNDEEEFYKIGRTFLTVKQRFKSNCQLPYYWKIVELFEGEAEEMFHLEADLKKLNKPHKYLPKNKFDGRYECFKQITI
jgi:hypothetical protein